MLRRSYALGLVLLASCSSSTDETPGSGPPDGLVGDVRESVTWEDGQKLAGVVRIVEGTTVTIAPGAKIVCNEATQILLGGTLKVNAKDNHASIKCPKWEGILVASKGRLDIDGLDIENAATGYKTTAQAGECVVKNSKILTSIRPFEVGANSKLTLDHVEASVPATVSGFDKSYVEVFGSLDAKYLKYQAQANEGIMVREGGDATITDSELVGQNAQDLVSSYGGNFLNVSYTTMTGAHCGPHLQGVKTAVFDHITSVGNIYGITVYAGDDVLVKDSNLSGTAAWLDKEGDHGTVKIENVYVAVNAAGVVPPARYEPGVKTNPLTTDIRVETEIPGAGPRGE